MSYNELVHALHANGIPLSGKHGSANIIISDREKEIKMLIEKSTAMFKSIYFIKCEALIVCKICKEPIKVSPPELSMDRDDLKSLTDTNITESITERQRVDGWHHDYCPRCTKLNAERIAEEEFNEQI